MNRTVCVDLLTTLDQRQKELANVRADISETQLKILQSTRPESLFKHYEKSVERNNELERQIDSLKIVIATQDKALDLLDIITTIDALIESPVPEQSDENLAIRLSELKNIYDKAQEEMNVRRETLMRHCLITEKDEEVKQRAPQLAKSNKYFAYDTDMSLEQLKRHLPRSTVKTIGPTKLDNYQLTFNKADKQQQIGLANISSFESGQVWGVVYELTDDQMKRLDGFKGVPTYAMRTATPSGYVYTAVKPQAGLKPLKTYLSTMIQGAQSHGLPDSYIAELQKIETLEPVPVPVEPVPVPVPASVPVVQQVEPIQVQQSPQERSQALTVGDKRRAIFKDLFSEPSFRERDCPKIPSKNGYASEKLKSLALRFGLDPKNMTKEQLCAKLAKLLIEP
jgi:gamma-glutamylcyclotransferase